MDGQKCEHPQCTCYVDLGQLYCSELCKSLDVADGDAPPRARCGCGHVGCVKA